MSEDASAAPVSSRGERLRALLASERLARSVPLLAVVAMLPVLFQGLQLDDHHLRVGLLGSPNFEALARPAWRLFAFFDPSFNAWARDRGLCPWWIDPQMRVLFLRPLAALTHWVDFHAWPAHPGLMHAHSLAWYAALAALASALYRRLLGRATWVAGFASVTYALDYTHGQVVEWIANRNALVAACFGLLSVALHVDNARAQRTLFRASLSALSLAAALCSGESALGAGALLLAFALCLDEGPWRTRARALAPHAVVALAWAVAYRAGSFGVRHSGLYFDPSSEPLLFLRNAIAHAPVLLSGELAGPPDGYVLLDAGGQRAMALACTLVVALAATALAPLVRASRHARFFLLALVLGALPSLATFPAARLLLLPGFGALGLLALLLEALADPGTAARLWPRPAGHKLARAVGLGVGFAHLFVAPFSLQITSQQMYLIERVLRRHADALGDAPALSGQRVVVVNSPDVAFLGYTSLIRETQGRVVPRSLLQLASGARTVELYRPDTHTLVVRVASGFYRTGTELLVRRAGTPMPVGTALALTDVTLEVTATAPDGVPTEASVRFARPLEDPSLRWLVWRGRELVPFELPAVGARVAIAPQLPSL